jgi:serine/threonine protein kinase
VQTHELMEKIGRGKYSDVFKCINTQTNKFSVVKVLKPGMKCIKQLVRDSKIKR